MSDETAVDPTATSDQSAAAEKRKAAAEGAIDSRAAQYIEALKIERAGYVVRGLEDRVAQVDAAIKHWSAGDKPKRTRKA
ncbi:hypothetical protein [Cellulomonas composti]|uniref:Uncharacterized protein n=1 Tax=Cellulomonas composti TaxID=266130 RepID=A0A511JBJ4_9CELL|nr:hypothetical protein [Cellulomonas composti]GEL95360.1 hypothetical protein CCO02nite_20180 [Cellulomonas composti]